MTDKKRPGFINARRRGFLQGAAVTGGAVATGVASGVAAAEPEQTPVESIDKSRGKGYERTEHVARYYARARF